MVSCIFLEGSNNIQIIPIIISILSLIISIYTFIRNNNLSLSKSKYQNANKLVNGKYSVIVSDIIDSKNVSIEQCESFQRINVALNNSLKICKVEKERKYKKIRALLMRLEDDVFSMNRNGKDDYIDDFKKTAHEIVKQINKMYLHRF